MFPLNFATNVIFLHLIGYLSLGSIEEVVMLQNKMKQIGKELECYGSINQFVAEFCQNSYKKAYT